MILKYEDIFRKLINGYRRVKGRDPSGLDLIKIKLEAAERVRESSKIVPFKARPDSPYGQPGGWMDKPETGIETLTVTKKTKPGKINYEEVQKKLPDVELYGDETFDELLEIEKTGKHPRDKKAHGGQIKKEKEIIDLSTPEGLAEFKKIAPGLLRREYPKVRKISKDEEPKRKKKAAGGRIGFALGGMNRARRAFLKMLMGGAGAVAAAKTGLLGLLKGTEKVKDVAKVAPVVKEATGAPDYLFELANIIRKKGKDISKNTSTVERETVKRYKGVELYETPDGFRIKAEGKSPYEGGKEVELEYRKTVDVADEGTSGQREIVDEVYEEATVRPDMEGKMKDVEFEVDEIDHANLRKIVEDEIEGFADGGLAYLLGGK